MSTVLCGNCKQYHNGAAEVRECYFGSVKPAERQPKPATESQQDYAQMLYRKRQGLPEHSELDHIDVENQINEMDAIDISSFIQKMKDQPLRGGFEGLPVSAGMYERQGDIYKVQQAVHGSGNLYAKIWVWIDQVESEGRGKFQYAPGAIRSLTAKDKMPLEKAQQFGKIYGVCCVCGRTLTDERSIAEGIGPVCAGKGWWK